MHIQQKISEIARLLLAYGTVMGAMVRQEANQELVAIRTDLRRKCWSAAIVLLGVVWLNVALLILIIDSPYRQLAPLVLGALLTMIGVALAVMPSARSKNGWLPETRHIVQAELNELGILSPATQGGVRAAEPTALPVADVAPEHTLSPAGAQARLRDLRIELTQHIKPGHAAAYHPPGIATDDPAQFQPRSKTMQWLMNNWKGDGKKQLGSIALSALGLIASRRSSLRGALAVAGALRALSKTDRQRA